MVKSCIDIAKEIETLKSEIKANKIVNIVLDDIVDKKKCESSSAFVMCTNCNCWKITKE